MEIEKPKLRSRRWEKPLVHILEGYDELLKEGSDFPGLGKLPPLGEFDFETLPSCFVILPLLLAAFFILIRIFWFFLFFLLRFM